MDHKIRALRLGKVFTGSQEVYHNYDYLLDKRNSKHCREYPPTPGLYMISICFRYRKKWGGGGSKSAVTSTEASCWKVQLQIQTRKSNSKVRLESPTRKSNSKMQLESPTRNSNSKSQLEIPTRNPNSKSQLGT